MQRVWVDGDRADVRRWLPRSRDDHARLDHPGPRIDQPGSHLDSPGPHLHEQPVTV